MLTLARCVRVATRTPSLVRLYHPNVIDHYENPRNVGMYCRSVRFSSDSVFRPLAELLPHTRERRPGLSRRSLYLFG